MKILIDTNVLIDYLMRRVPYSDDAEKILFLCKNMQIKGCMAAHSVMNIIYILRKEMTLSERKSLILALTEFIEIVGIDRKKIINILTDETFSDVEDCLQSECAVAFEADYIVTRNIKDFESSSIHAVLPNDFIKII